MKTNDSLDTAINNAINIENRKGNIKLVLRAEFKSSFWNRFQKENITQYIIIPKYDCTALGYKELIEKEIEKIKSIEEIIISSAKEEHVDEESRFISYKFPIIEYGLHTFLSKDQNKSLDRVILIVALSKDDAMQLHNRELIYQEVLPIAPKRYTTTIPDLQIKNRFTRYILPKILLEQKSLTL